MSKERRFSHELGEIQAKKDAVAYVKDQREALSERLVSQAGTTPLSEGINAIFHDIRLGEVNALAIDSIGRMSDKMATYDLQMTDHALASLRELVDRGALPESVYEKRVAEFKALGGSVTPDALPPVETPAPTPVESEFTPALSEKIRVEPIKEKHLLPQEQVIVAPILEAEEQPTVVSATAYEEALVEVAKDSLERKTFFLIDGNETTVSFRTKDTGEPTRAYIVLQQLVERGSLTAKDIQSLFPESGNVNPSSEINILKKKLVSSTLPDDAIQRVYGENYKVSYSLKEGITVEFDDQDELSNEDLHKALPPQNKADLEGSEPSAQSFTKQDTQEEPETTEIIESVNIPDVVEEKNEGSIQEIDSITTKQIAEIPPIVEEETANAVAEVSKDTLHEAVDYTSWEGNTTFSIDGNDIDITFYSKHGSNEISRGYILLQFLAEKRSVTSSEIRDFFQAHEDLTVDPSRELQNLKAKLLRSLLPTNIIKSEYIEGNKANGSVYTLADEVTVRFPDSDDQLDSEPNNKVAPLFQTDLEIVEPEHVAEDITIKPTQAIESHQEPYKVLEEEQAVEMTSALANEVTTEEKEAGKKERRVTVTVNGKEQEYIFRQRSGNEPTRNYRILRLIAQNNGITAEEMMEALQDEAIKTKMYLQAEIGSLRKKIEKNPSLPKIVLQEKRFQGDSLRYSIAEDVSIAFLDEADELAHDSDLSKLSKELSGSGEPAIQLPEVTSMQTNRVESVITVAPQVGKEERPAVQAPTETQQERVVHAEKQAQTIKEVLIQIGDEEFMNVNFDVSGQRNVEYELLKYLADHPDATKDQLKDVIDPNRPQSVRSVDMHIQYLQRKLGDTGEKPRIIKTQGSGKHATYFISKDVGVTLINEGSASTESTMHEREINAAPPTIELFSAAEFKKVEVHPEPTENPVNEILTEEERMVSYQEAAGMCHLLSKFRSITIIDPETGRREPLDLSITGRLMDTFMDNLPEDHHTVSHRDRHGRSQINTKENEQKRQQVVETGRKISRIIGNEDREKIVDEQYQGIGDLLHWMTEANEGILQGELEKFIEDTADSYYAYVTKRKATLPTEWTLPRDNT